MEKVTLCRREPSAGSWEEMAYVHNMHTLDNRNGLDVMHVLFLAVCIIYRLRFICMHWLFGECTRGAARLQHFLRLWTIETFSAPSAITTNNYKRFGLVGIRAWNKHTERGRPGKLTYVWSEIWSEVFPPHLCSYYFQIIILRGIVCKCYFGAGGQWLHAQRPSGYGRSFQNYGICGAT
jgi:hypothetical protein